jgi:hypothetical protein
LLKVEQLISHAGSVWAAHSTVQGRAPQTGQTAYRPRVNLAASFSMGVGGFLE